MITLTLSNSSWHLPANHRNGVHLVATSELLVFALSLTLPTSPREF